MKTKSAASGAGTTGSNSAGFSPLWMTGSGHRGSPISSWNFCRAKALSKITASVSGSSSRSKFWNSTPLGELGGKCSTPPCVRVERNALADAGGCQPRVETALGAMTVKHLDLQFAGQPPDPEGRREVSRPEHPRHRHAVDAQLRHRPQRFQPLRGQCVRAQAVDDDADLVAALRQDLASDRRHAGTDLRRVPAGSAGCAVVPRASARTTAP